MQSCWNAIGWEEDENIATSCPTAKAAVMLAVARFDRGLHHSWIAHDLLSPRLFMNSVFLGHTFPRLPFRHTHVAAIYIRDSLVIQRSPVSRKCLPNSLFIR
jgi:hypothetical protein